MKKLLDQYLYKLGLSDYDDLSPEEKETYRTWETSLTGRKITDADVQEFFEREKFDVEKKIVLDNSPKLDTFLKMKLELIMAIQQFVASPRIEAEITEQGIRSFIETN